MKTIDNHQTQFQTPNEVIDYMIDQLPDGINTILEPTPGMGKIVKKLELLYQVTAPVDYFLLDPNLMFDAVIMNPPFSAKYANLENAPDYIKNEGMKLGYLILTQCMEKSDFIVALMPWFTISDSDKRLRHIKNFGVRSLTALPRKTFLYARIQTMVMVLQKNYKGPTEFKVFDYIKERSQIKMELNHSNQ